MSQTPVPPAKLARWRSVSRACSAILAVSLATAAPLSAAADEPPPPPPPPVAATDNPRAAEADGLSEQAKTLYRDQKYKEAFALFAKAQSADPRPAFLYNMAKCKEKLAEYEEAVGYLEAYIQLHRAQNGGSDPGNLVDVQALIRELKRRAFEALPEVSVQSVPPGAQVLENGATLGTTPLLTRMQPGAHKIILKLDRHTDLDAEVLVPQSGKVSVVLSMKSTVKRAALAAWANVRGAQVIVDGKVVAVTPFAGQIEVEPGPHQVSFARAGYASIDQQVHVPEDKLVRVKVVMERQDRSSGWRSYLGWPLLIGGALAAGGGAVAAHYADKEYRGSPMFNELELWQNTGYFGGGSAAGLGLVLVIWDGLRDPMPADERVDGPALGAGVEVVPLGAAKTP